MSFFGGILYILVLVLAWHFFSFEVVVLATLALILEGIEDE